MSLDKWEQQPGGLYLAVTPFNKAIPEHREAASSVMREVVRTVANVHGAEFNNHAFHNNLRALYTGDIKLDLYLAKWEVCEHKPPVYLGAALGWDTVGIDAQGNIRPAIYTEDVCLLSGQIRKLIRAKPAGKKFPEEGLQEGLERISLQNAAEQGIWFKYGEVSPGNTRMMRSMIKNGGVFGDAEQSAILEFQRLPADLHTKFPMTVKPIGLRRDGVFDNNSFIARWRHEDRDIRFITTRGQATAVGKHRVDIRPWHNGSLPGPEEFECVIASALRTIKHEVEVERKWGRETQAAPGPTIPLLESSKQVVHAMYGNAGDELLALPAAKPKSFGLAMPEAHVYVINDEPTRNAFERVGARQRIFGDKITIPGVNLLRLAA